MVAFCVIVGDTIPHVLTAIFPHLPDTSVVWLFADRRFIIVIFILGISFPLSLYRDIAKVCTWRLVEGNPKSDLLKLTNVVVSEGIYIGVDQHGCNYSYGYHARRSGRFRAQGIPGRIFDHQQRHFSGNWRYFFR